VIEGKNIVTLANSNLRGEQLCGVMIYQSFSGDAEVGVARFVMNGGSIEAATGPLFYINNTKAEVQLTGAKLLAPSGVIIRAAAGRWGYSWPQWWQLDPHSGRANPEWQY
jgi:hypothetical protein